MNFSSQPTWIKAGKWLLLSPALLAVFASVLSSESDFVRRQLGWSRQLKTDSSTFLLSMAISRNGRVIAATGQPMGNENRKSGTIYCWDARTLKPLLTLPPQKRQVGVSRTLALSPDGRYLGASRSDYRYSVYDLSTKRMMWRSGYAQGAEFSPDGKSIALVGVHANKPGLHLLTSAKGRLIRTIPSKGSTFVSWSPSGKILACGGPVINIQRPDQDHLRSGVFIELWNVTTGRKIRTIWSELTDNAHFSPDGKSLVATGYVRNSKNAATAGARVRLFDVQTGRLKWTKGYNFCEAIFSPDGRLIAALQYPKVALNEKRNVFLLDPRTGKEIRKLSFRQYALPSYSPSALAFSPNSKRLFARGASSVVVWDLN